MSTEAENAGEAAVRGAQRQSDGMLRADQVAAIAAPWLECGMTQNRRDIETLVAQDGRWRTLVGTLVRAYTTYITSREATDRALAAGEARVANSSARTEQAALEQLRATLAEARQSMAQAALDRLMQQ